MVTRLVLWAQLLSQGRMLLNEGKINWPRYVKNGKKVFKKVDMDVYKMPLVIPMNTDNGGVQFEDKNDHTKSSKILYTKVQLV